MGLSVLVVGAGMAGLTAARRLREAGFGVTVLDKGRAVGGRMATRRKDGAAFDHGAQHVSARSPEFAAQMRALVDAGVARVWLRTRSVTHPERGVEERFAGVGGMRRVPEALAAGLDVETGVVVDRLDLSDGVTAFADGRPLARGDAVILTPPLPQTIELLSSAGIATPARLDSVAYDATLAVMARLDAPAELPDGHLTRSEGPVAWMADNQHKGVSAVPALTLHSTPAFAAEHLTADRSTWARALLDAARPHHQGEVVEVVPHRWRYSQPQVTSDEGARSVPAPVPVVLAGEVFAGARVEGAFLSGLAAAAEVEAALS